MLWIQSCGPLIAAIPIFLDCLRDAGVKVRLDAHERVDDLIVADGDADAPASHVVGLGERIELDSHFHGSGNLQEGGGDVTVVGDVGVGKIMANEQVMTAREMNDALKESQICDATGRVVRIIQPEQFRSIQHSAWNRIKVRKVAVGLEERHVIRFAARKSCPNRVNR